MTAKFVQIISHSGSEMIRKLLEDSEEAKIIEDYILNDMIDDINELDKL